MVCEASGRTRVSDDEHQLVLDGPACAPLEIVRRAVRLSVLVNAKQRQSRSYRGYVKLSGSPPKNAMSPSGAITSLRSLKCRR